MPNDRLRDALLNKGLTPEAIAERLAVDPKTVERWITTGRTPYPRYRHAIGVKRVLSRAYDEALRFSSFENMKQLEATGGIQNKILAPGDPNDPESYKVRHGKVGAFADYLSPEDQNFAA